MGENSKQVKSRQILCDIHNKEDKYWKDILFAEGRKIWKILLFWALKTLLK